MHVEMRGSSAWTIYGCLTRRGGEGRGGGQKQTKRKRGSLTAYLVHAVRVVAATPGLEVPVKVKLPLTESQAID